MRSNGNGSISQQLQIDILTLSRSKLSNVMSYHIVIIVCCIGKFDMQQVLESETRSILRGCAAGRRVKCGVISTRVA